jgi:hypothetical protein
MPAPQDYLGAAQRTQQSNQQATNAQTAANRPNQSNPFSSVTWTQGPGGWQQNTQFTGPLAGLSAGLQQQAADAMSKPFSLDGLPALGGGEAARQQAIDAAYGEASKRLTPQFEQQEQALRSRLLGQGLAEGSEAYNNALKDFGAQRNDAFNSALSGAIGQGTAAGNAIFNNNLAARQQGMSELLRQRGQAFGELQGLQGFTQQQGFSQAGNAGGVDFTGAAQLGGAQDWMRYLKDQQNTADAIRGGGQAVGMAAQLLPFFLSDERAKQDVVRLPVEAIVGVPLAHWRYLPEHGDASVLYVGVLAQDLQRVAPEHVRARGDGMLEVHPLFAPRPL